MSDLWRTPDFVFQQLNDVFNFTVDAAATESNKKVDKFFIDGLSSSWKGCRVFCNPPFSNKDDWILKANNEVNNNDCPIVVMILPLNSFSSPAVWDTIHKNGYFYEVLRQRISFLDENNKPISGNNTGTLIIYFKKRVTVKKEILK